MSNLHDNSTKFEEHQEICHVIMFFRPHSRLSTWARYRVVCVLDQVELVVVGVVVVTLLCGCFQSADEELPLRGVGLLGRTQRRAGHLPRPHTHVQGALQGCHQGYQWVRFQSKWRRSRFINQAKQVGFPGPVRFDSAEPRSSRHPHGTICCVILTHDWRIDIIFLFFFRCKKGK